MTTHPPSPLSSLPAAEQHLVGAIAVAAAALDATGTVNIDRALARLERSASAAEGRIGAAVASLRETVAAVVARLHALADGILADVPPAAPPGAPPAAPTFLGPMPEADRQFVEDLARREGWTPLPPEVAEAIAERRRLDPDAPPVIVAALPVAESLPAGQTAATATVVPDFAPGCDDEGVDLEADVHTEPMYGPRNGTNGTYGAETARESSEGEIASPGVNGEAARAALEDVVKRDAAWQKDKTEKAEAEAWKRSLAAQAAACPGVERDDRRPLPSVPVVTPGKAKKRKGSKS